ncbi:hypothetical protein [Telluribacter sp.]|jgi:hypothetical protein|uniref:hypothetical protein n=1 Tax=Telluribacter sp. TaxID=1978767 RepID=UPI002E15FDD7|nr:hypothetical protein [Telluribacter sp.]
MKPIIKLAFLSLLLCLGCEKDSLMDAGGPISRYLRGHWELEKIVTPTRTLTGSQIGYREIVETGNDGTKDYDKVYRNDTLIATYDWTRVPGPTGSAAKMEITINYWPDIKRFHKIMMEPGLVRLETSGYVPEIGGAQDTVRYFYRRLE